MKIAAGMKRAGPFLDEPSLNSNHISLDKILELIIIN